MHLNAVTNTEKNSNRKTVTVVHLENILRFPPVINLVENMLVNGNSVNLVSYNIEKIPRKIREHPNLHYLDLPFDWGGLDLKSRIIGYVKRNRVSHKIVRAVKEYMNYSDLLWTTTDRTVRGLGKTVLDYKHIMQLMELEEWCPQFTRFPFKFPIENYAKKAWKVVVPETNRAYIQKTWWDLNDVPYVLPNKPYNTEIGEITPDMDRVLNTIKSETRKIILYLGLIGKDRDIEVFSKAVEKLGKDYCMYILGKPLDMQEKSKFDLLIEKYPSTLYLGYFEAPKHLAVVQYAYIGLLPYMPSKSSPPTSELNALYCAPNKIFEYARYGVPMLGTDVPGLYQPFEKFDMGVCCKKLTVDSIIDAVHEIEKRHDEMSANCKRFYDSVDLDKIVEDILYEEV